MQWAIIAGESSQEEPKVCFLGIFGEFKSSLSAEIAYSQESYKKVAQSILHCNCGASKIYDTRKLQRTLTASESSIRRHTASLKRVARCDDRRLVC